MKAIKVGVEETLDVPGDADTLLLTHEWGGVEEISTPSSTYSWTPTSIGVIRLEWYEAEDLVSTEFIECYVPILDEQQFIAESNLPMDSNMFTSVERTARLLIQNFTNQKFGPLTGQSMVIQGDGGNSISLPTRITKITSVIDSYGSDITEFCEIYPNEPTIIQRRAPFTSSFDTDTKRDVVWHSYELFKTRVSYAITGNWGWAYVPSEIAEAASIMITDAITGSDASELRSQGVIEAQIGDFKMRLNADQWGTTGNTRADTMLSGYVNFGIGLV